VHPDDDLAAEEHGGTGKTEMWYIMDSSPESELIVGFKKETDKETYIKLLQENKLTEILNFEKVKPGDVFFLPAGRIHAIGAGLLVAEIQQTSNYTYRIFDWNRTDNQGNPRELHTELALKAMNFSAEKNYKTLYQEKKNTNINLVDCPYFTTNLLSFDKLIHKDYFQLDSFVIYICLEGNFAIRSEDFEEVTIQKGEGVLIPAVLKHLDLIPQTSSKIMEVYICNNGS
jgi:mannose-6-phosphate isomerase